MRFSAVSVALLAGVVAAAPQQSVQPITQISDGQIQAPPATSVAVPTVRPSVPAVSTPVVSVPVVSPPAGTATPVRPTSLASPIVPGVNSTAVAPTSAPVAGTSAPAVSRASSAAGSAASSAGVPQASTGAAADNAISFGGLVFAVAAAVFA